MSTKTRCFFCALLNYRASVEKKEIDFRTPSTLPLMVQKCGPTTTERMFIKLIVTNGRSYQPQVVRSGFPNSINTIHPWSLTWNLKIMASKRNLLFQGRIFRFHVKLQGCELPMPTSSVHSVKKIKRPRGSSKDNSPQRLLPLLPSGFVIE